MNPSSTVPGDADPRAIWNSLYDPGAQAAIWGEDAAEHVTGPVAELWAARGCRSILALPSGDGRNILPLARRFPGIVACDASANALSILETRLKALGLPPLARSVQDVYATTFPEASFDAVLTWDILSHLDRPEAALVEMRRVLRRGGLLTVNFFADDDENLWDATMRRLSEKEYTSKVGLYYRAYGREDVEALAQAAGGGMSARIEKIEWREGPHPGYREYDHTHKGWVLTLGA